MPPAYQITDESYEPNHELQEFLSEVSSVARLHYEEEESFHLPGGFEAIQLSYVMTFYEFELTGTDTIAPIGVMVSLDGRLGCATSVALANSLTYGEPTQAYIDEGNVTDTGPPQYRDLTTEWYVKPAVEAGVPEARLKNRVVNLDADLIALDRLEEWAQVWLEAGDHS